MSIFGDIVIKTCGDKIGYLFNNTLFNVTTSGVGIWVTGGNCARSSIKAFASPLLICKGLYIGSAFLNGVACISSSICLISGYSSIAPLPILSASLAHGASIGAKGCNALADCMDPSSSLTTKAVDTCLDIATKNFT